VHSQNHTTVELLGRFDIGYTFQRLGIWNECTQNSMMAEFKTLVRSKVKRRGNRNWSAAVGN
jgi:hypothetical protein